MNTEIGQLPSSGKRTLPNGKGHVLSPLANFYICFLYVIAPVKLGSVIDPASIGFFPLNAVEWLLSPWPPSITAALTGIALLLSVLSSNLSTLTRLLNYKHLLMPTAFLLLASIIGFIHTTETNYATLFIWHMLAVFNFGLAVCLQVINSPKSRDLFLLGLAIGSLYMMGLGISQITFGFEDTKEFATKMTAEQGWDLSPDLQRRIDQKRVFATFTYPNSFAAHLIAVIPITLLCVWSWSKAVSPPFISQVVLTGLTAFLSLWILYFTGSRGAICSLILSCLIILAFRHQTTIKYFEKNKRNTAFGILLILATVGLLLTFSFQGRTFSSIGARFEYFKAACKMFELQPFLGVGLGEFFPWYLRLKPIGAEETRLVHNLFLHFLSQCGIFGGIAAAYFLLQPFVLAYFVFKKRLIPNSMSVLWPMLIGCLAWNLHSLTDFNVQIPGTMLIVATLPLLVVQPKNGEIPTLNPNARLITGFFLFILSIVGISSIFRLQGEKSYQILYYKYIKKTDVSLLKNDALLAAKKLPFSPYPWDLLGKKALQQRQVLLAQMAFEEASKRAPHRAAYHAYLAQCYGVSGDLMKAKYQIGEALKWYPQEPKFKKISQYLDHLLHKTEKNKAQPTHRMLE